MRDEQNPLLSANPGQEGLAQPVVASEREAIQSNNGAQRTLVNWIATSLRSSRRQADAYSRVASGRGACSNWLTRDGQGRAVKIRRT